MHRNSLDTQLFLTPPTSEIPPKVVHIVLFNVVTLLKDRDILISNLQQDELYRMKKLTAPGLAERFGVIRGMLRAILGYYLEVRPSKISLTYNNYGKPIINPETESAKIFFNLSHSKEMAAFAFSRDGHIGIDIEYLDPLRKIEKLSHYICSPLELSDFSSLNRGDDKLQAFYTLWTRKEAFIKALGSGLSMGLSAIHIGFKPKSSQIFYKNELKPNWMIKDIPSQLTNYKIAVAHELPQLD